MEQKKSFMRKKNVSFVFLGQVRWEGSLQPITQGGNYLLRPSNQQCWFVPFQEITQGGNYLLRPSNQ